MHTLFGTKQNICLALEIMITLFMKDVLGVGILMAFSM